MKESDTLISFEPENTPSISEQIVFSESSCSTLKLIVFINEAVSNPEVSEVGIFLLQYHSLYQIYWERRLDTLSPNSTNYKSLFVLLINQSSIFDSIQCCNKMTDLFLPKLFDSLGIIIFGILLGKMSLLVSVIFCQEYFNENLRTFRSLKGRVVRGLGKLIW